MKRITDKKNILFKLSVFYSAYNLPSAVFFVLYFASEEIVLLNNLFVTW